jgi:hypothetical protein
MIEIEKDALVFSFPEVHRDAVLRVESVLEHRVLDPLCAFGLAERDPVSAIVLAPERARYRLTPLFDRFLSLRMG